MNQQKIDSLKLKLETQEVMVKNSQQEFNAKWIEFENASTKLKGAKSLLSSIQMDLDYELGNYQTFSLKVLAPIVKKYNLWREIDADTESCCAESEDCYYRRNYYRSSSTMYSFQDYIFCDVCINNDPESWFDLDERIEINLRELPQEAGLELRKICNSRSND